MLLMTKTTTISLWVPPNHQFQSNNYLLRHKNVILPSKLPSRSSQLLSPTFDTNSCSRIPATLSLNSTSPHQIANYNADICRFCAAADLQTAMDLVCRSEEIIIDLKTYCDILQLCAELKALHHGKRVHNLICSRGVEINSVLGSKFVFMYVSCGDAREARRVFDNISVENVFLWNFMMNAYAKMGDYEESVSLFKRMQEVGVEPDSYTFSCVCKCSAAIEDDSLGERIHGYVIKMGFGSNKTVVNSMIALYFKRGRIEDAHQLFDEMPDRDVITWNTMISGYVANGLSRKGFEVFKDMIGSRVAVDLATMVSVVVACANTGVVDLGRVVHGYAVKGGFDKKTKFSNTLLDMYSKCGDTNAAFRVFKKMDERSVVSWTSMIAGFAREGRSDEAIELFLDMKNEGVKPDAFTVTTVLHACVSNRSLENGKEVHDYVKENGIRSLPVSNALMDMYAKCGRMDDSYSVFSETTSRDIVSWNTVIGGFSKNRLPSKSLDFFIEMQREFKPDNVTVASVLPACASLAALNKGREIHGHVLRNGLASDRYIVNALLDMYVKCGALILAKSLFDTTVFKDLFTWTIMVAGYGIHGFGKEAVSTFEKMRENGIDPDSASFASILFACGHSVLLQEGRKFFKIMVNECKIEPELEHYACMVDLLSRAGRLSEAYGLIESMPVKPDAAIWGLLLCGCWFHRDVRLAEKVADRIFELEPENTRYYVLLADIYAEAEKWEEMGALRDGIGRRVLRKNTECSWIEINGKVNVFVAGNKENPEAKRVESFLENLRVGMEKDGFGSNRRYGLVEMEKGGAVCGHSEKLAIGFGILKLAPSKTIRVTKNVRVCRDCHEMAKFVSKKVGRQILLRDCNRFHHFKDGVCSCRGYW